jgi:hypothetical protein
MREIKRLILPLELERYIGGFARHDLDSLRHLAGGALSGFTASGSSEQPLMSGTNASMIAAQSFSSDPFFSRKSSIYKNRRLNPLIQQQPRPCPAAPSRTSPRAP